ncbi:MAG: hypothetical protein ACLP5H_31650 [Desulfomonilaceae bacterium]
MGKYLTAVTLVLTCMCLSAAGAGVNIAGNWESRFMGSLIQAKIDQNGDAVSGVAYVYSPLGQKDTYHFTGKIDGAKVVASHHDGHLFSGNVTPAGHLVGVLKTKGGHQVPMEATRR